ncbi:unnamed protein product [Pieris macdunnoughi]|uniref:Uncharacterized protein n=1 Tax=Pieris macdunnoughi TaxID=345717 RepID=A0A821UNL4_9NEOP|nr:unnamed protein product [Pieris macdunnoughi]
MNYLAVNTHNSKLKSVMADSKTLFRVPSYNGDPIKLYYYLNCAKQWLDSVGETQENVMLLLGKLEGKAAIYVSMTDHGFKWEHIEEILKQECNKEDNTLIIEILNLKRHGSFQDLIRDLKQKLFFIKSKLWYIHRDPILVDAVMVPYMNVAQITLRNSLPYRDQIYVSFNSFAETASKILQLEAQGRFDIKSSQALGSNSNPYLSN